MGDLPHYFDIILFAMVAAFLVLRLRSVLGRRTGQERRPDPVLQRAEAPGDKAGDKVVSLGNRNPAAPPPVTTAPPADAVAAGLARGSTVRVPRRAGRFLLPDGLLSWHQLAGAGCEYGDLGFPGDGCLGSGGVREFRAGFLRAF